MRNSHRSQQIIGPVLIIAMLSSWLSLPVYGKEDLARSANLASALASAPAKLEDSTHRKVAESYGNLALSFEPNEGQFASDVKFASRAAGQTLLLTPTEAVLKFAVPARSSRGERTSPKPANDAYQSAGSETTASEMRMGIVGANPSSRVTGLEELSGKSNYFIGNDNKKWRTNVANYARVKYEQIYPGVDLVYYGNSGQLEYDFLVARGANPRVIRLAFKGAGRVQIDKNGDLVFSTTAGEIRQPKPVAYQIVRGVRKLIGARYVVGGKYRIGFRVSRYDRRKPLVIDPVLLYSTYLGGSGLDNAQSVAVDANGNAYITGSTNSFNFPTANPFQPARGGGLTFTSDVFVTKLNPTGTALVYSTYLGGDAVDSGFAIALDSGGNAYVTGQTSSPNFPTANPLQGAPAGQSDAFVAKLNPQGSGLVNSSYLGGIFDDSGRSIAVDALGAALVVGNTVSPDFPLANALRSTIVGQDAFVTKLNPAGTALIYSTFLGGSGSDSATDIALDSTGSVYVTGGTRSSDFPTVNALQSTYTDKTLFKSTDNGTSWAAINNGVPASAAVLALAIDPLNTGTLYAGTSSGIFKTTDGGVHWVPATQGLPASTNLFDLAIDPLTPSILYAAASISVHKSINGGGVWESILDTFINTSIAIDPKNPSTVYLGNRTLGVLVTTDGGATWENTDFPFASARVTSLAIDPTHPGSFYVGTESFGIHRYPAPCANILPNSTPVRCVTVAPGSPSIVYVGTGLGGIQKSTDAGITWNPASTGLADPVVEAIAVNPLNPKIVYSATRNQCYKSTDEGDHWSPLSFNPQLLTVAVKDIVIDPTSPSTIYAGATGGGEAYVTKLNPSGSAYVFSTFLGGSGADSITGIAVDSTNAVYVVGTSNSLDIPSVTSLRPFAGGTDLLLAKITPDGGALSFSTYFGGVFQEVAAGISIDSSGSVWVTGRTNSPDLPTTPDATPITSPCLSGSCLQAFVSKFSSDGTMLAYSSYLGGNTPPASAGGIGFGVAVDASGSAYVVGQTLAVDFPTTPGAFQVNSGGGTSDVFITKIGAPCAYSLSRTSQTSPAGGGSSGVDVTTAIGCPWNAVSNDSWIFITSTNSGTGSSTISFEIRENFEEKFRIGTVTIGGQTFTVLQEGLASVECANSISPTFGSFPPAGGSSSVNVIASKECIWTAVSNADWITITSNDNGIGIGTVGYSVALNSGTASRNGTMSIAGRTFAIKQKGNGTSGKGKP